MKKFLILFLLLWSSPAFATIAFVNSVSAGSSNGSSVTTSAVNMTGANFLVAVLSYSGICAPSDSSSNSWTCLTAAGVSPNSQICYVPNATVSSSQTFTCSGGSSFFPALVVYGFSGVATSSPFDKQAVGTQSFGSTCQPSSITPTANGEVLITGVSYAQTNSFTINSSFNTPVQVQFNVASSDGISTSYLVQSTAAAISPTWTAQNLTAGGCTIASFLAASGGAAQEHVFMSVE